jgi:hypothetical protein
MVPASALRGCRQTLPISCVSGPSQYAVSFGQSSRVFKTLTGYEPTREADRGPVYRFVKALVPMRGPNRFAAKLPKPGQTYQRYVPGRRTRSPPKRQRCRS